MQAVLSNSYIRPGALCLARLLPALPASAQLRLYDGFDYLGQVAGGGFAGGTNTAGASWGGPWTDPLTNYNFVADSLTYESGEPLATAGNKGEGSAMRAVRAPFHGIAEGTVYVSFLMNPLDNAGAYYMGFIGNQPTGSLARVLIGIREGTYAIGDWTQPKSSFADSGIPAANNRFMAVSGDGCKKPAWHGMGS